jgi:hypothetical protein
MPPLRYLAILGLSFLCAVLFILQFEGWPAPFVLQVEMQTDRYARLGLLYDQGTGFRQQDSITRLFAGGPAFKWINFQIAGSQVRNLSLLQYDGSEPLRIRAIRLKMLGRQPVELSTDRVHSGHAGTPVIRNGDVVEIRGIGGSANVGIALPTAFLESRTSRRLRRGSVIALCASVLALALLTTKGRHSANSAVISGRNQRVIRNGTVIFLICAYCLASVAKLNGSATALWEIYADRQAPTAGLIFGIPKTIRADEWVGETPWILSQAARQFAVENPAVGNGVMPLLNNLPARHWTMFFRPQMWGFFITDLEHAFAFYWNFKWFGLVLGAFLFLEAIACRNAVIALFGVLLLFFSPFIQWWFSTPTCMPEMIGAFFFFLWSLVLIRSAKSRWAIAGGGVLLIASIAQFVFCAYPRFQIPLLHLALFLIAGALIANRHRIVAERYARFRVYVLTIAGALTVLVVAGWYHDVAGAIHRVSALVYPGKVFSTGGGLPWQRLFMPFLEFAMTDQRYPSHQMNVCEAAGFLFIAPLIAFAFGRDLLRRRFDPIIIASLAFMALGIWFMLFGFSDAVAKWTGFYLVYSARVVLAVSIASIIALCRYLGRANEKSRNLSLGIQLAAFAALILMLLAIFQSTNRQLAGFVGMSGVFVAAIFFALFFAAVWRREVAVGAILVLIPTIYANALVNPIGRGLPGFTRSEIFHWLSDIARARPDARWLVIGHASGRTNFLPQFVKATGADTFGGFRCEPDERIMRALDPSRKYSFIYNRYAEILFLPSTEAEPSFELTFINHYNVLLPLRPEFLHRLGVNFVLEIEMPAAEGAIEGYTTIGEREGLRLLKRDVL